jgi:microcompartment protein CcmK/EutM
MFMGKVIGTVWSTVKWPQLEGLKFLLVRPYHLDELAGRQGTKVCHDAVVAADILDAGIGEDVILAYGHSARMALEPWLEKGALPGRPVDAAVVAIVDKFHLDEAETRPDAARSKK